MLSLHDVNADRMTPKNIRKKKKILYF